MEIFAKWNSEIRKNARSNNNIRVFVTRRWLFKESLPSFFFLKREREDILFSGERDRPWKDMNNDRANHSFPRFYLRSLCLKQIRIHPPHPRAFENLTRANRKNKIQSVVASFVTMFYLSELRGVKGRGGEGEGGIVRVNMAAMEKGLACFSSI